MLGMRKLPHERMRENLSAYVDGELSEATRLEVERHLKACAECQAGLDSLRSLANLLHQVPEMELRLPFTLVGTPSPERTAPGYQWALRTAALATGVALFAVFSADLVGVLPGDPSGIGVATAPRATQATVMLQESVEPTTLPEVEVDKAEDEAAELAATPTPVVEAGAAPPGTAAAGEELMTLRAAETTGGIPLASPTEPPVMEVQEEPAATPTKLVQFVPEWQIAEVGEDASNAYLPAVEGSLAALLVGTSGASLYLAIRRRRSKA